MNVKLCNFKFVLATVATLLVSFSSHAAIFKFDLKDSLKGGERPPNYGLRLDGLYSGNQSHVYTFSFINVMMTVDSNTGTAVLGGTMLGGTEGDGEARDTGWEFTFTYTGLDVDANDGSWEFQSGADGSGSIWNVLGDSFLLVEFMGSDGWGPNGDGGPCRSGDGPWCGNGWVNHSITPNTPTQGWENIHLYASDFLYTGEPAEVSTPGVLSLIGLGLGLIVLRRKSKKA